MNKIFKYISIAAGTLFALAACNRIEAPAPEGPEAPASQGGREVVLKAIAPGTTKVFMDGYNILWEADDRIGVLDGMNPNCYREFVPFECRDINGNTATFSGTLNYYESGPVFAFYPYNPDCWVDDGGSVQLYRSGFQCISPDTGLDRESMWMTSYGDGYMYFEPIVGAAKFRVAQEGITSLTFTFEGAPQRTCSTSVIISHFDTSPVVDFPESDPLSYNITVEPEWREDDINAPTFKKDKDYYISLMPGTAKGVRVVATRQTPYPTHIQTDYSLTKSAATYDIQAGKMKNFGTLNFTRWYDEPIGDINFPRVNGDINLLLAEGYDFEITTEAPYTRFSFFDTSLPVYPNFGIRSENTSVAAVRGFDVIPMGMGETDITVWYPGSANGPEWAIDSRTYHVKVQKAFVNDVTYQITPFAITEGQTEPAAFVYSDEVVRTAYHDYYGWDLDYDGEFVTIPASITAGGQTFKVAGLANYAFRDTRPYCVSFDDGPVIIMGEAFSNSYVHLLGLPPTLKTIGSFGPLLDPDVSVFFNDKRSSNGYFTIDKNGLYSSEVFYLADRIGPASTAISSDYKNEIVVPEGIKEISNYAFLFTNCNKVVLPSTLNDFGNVGNFCRRFQQYYFGRTLEQLVTRSTAQAFDEFTWWLDDPQGGEYNFCYDAERTFALYYTDLVVVYPAGNEQFLGDWQEYVSGKMAAIAEGTLPSRKWFNSVIFISEAELGGNVAPLEDGPAYQW